MSTIEIKKLCNNLTKLNIKCKFYDKYSQYKRISMLKKIIYYIQIQDAARRANITRGANLYAIEFLKQNLCKYVKLKDVQEYYNMRNKQETGSLLGDPPRAFEMLRKNKLPNEWNEYIFMKIKYIKYSPRIKDKLNANIINDSKNKGDIFKSALIIKN